VHPGAHAATNPDKPACVMAGSGEVVTYRALDEGANQLAHLLRDRGLGVGDNLAVLMENNAAILTVAWGPQRSGLYYTAINDRLTPAEVELIVNDCGARALVASYDRRHVAAHLVGTTPAVHTRLMVGGTVPGFEPYEQAVAAMPTEAVPDAVEGLDFLYSSGTTGRPRGVRIPLAMNPVGTPTSATLILNRLYGLGPDGVYLCPAPLHHAGPLRFTMAAHRIGATAVVMERFDPVEMLRAVERHRVTHVLMVPTMFVRLLKLAEEERRRFDLSSLECAIHFAAPCPVPVKERMIEWWGPIVHEFYSATEANGFTTCSSEEWLAHRGTVGRPLMCKAHILDDDGRELGPGEVGVVWFESEQVYEYHNDPDKTAACRNERGWTTLGDIGYLDADGYLYLTDRQAFTIISGGENVYPRETEDVLVTHPKVMDAAVFGVPNDELGEEVKAVVQPVDPAQSGPALAEELIAFCRQHLAPFKCPRSVDFEPELPRHPTGKLYKRLLRDRYWQGRETRIV
jgi:long-chain acyl-CoA synthetase